MRLVLVVFAHTLLSNRHNLIIFVSALWKDHMKFALHQAFKYQWLFEHARTEPEPWLLADTDIVVQCDALEMRQRFAGESREQPPDVHMSKTLCA